MRIRDLAGGVVVGGGESGVPFFQNNIEWQSVR